MSTRKPKADTTIRRDDMKWRRVKNRILKAITVMSVFFGILSIIALDGNSVIPVIVLGICVTWGCLFGIANTK